MTKSFILADDDHSGSARRPGGRQGHVRRRTSTLCKSEWARVLRVQGYEDWQTVAVSQTGD